MDPISPWISQVGFGIVSALLGFWSWHLWNELKNERAKRDARQKDYETIIAKLITDQDTRFEEVIDRLFAWVESMREALTQNTVLIRELREGMDIYVKLEELQKLLRASTGKPRSEIPGTDG